jgi:hypothetical protein
MWPPYSCLLSSLFLYPTICLLFFFPLKDKRKSSHCGCWLRHQPNKCNIYEVPFTIFNAFDSLLLGRTVDLTSTHNKFLFCIHLCLNPFKSNLIITYGMNIKDRHFVLPISQYFLSCNRKYFYVIDFIFFLLMAKFFSSKRSWKQKRIKEITKSEHGHK